MRNVIISNVAKEKLESLFQFLIENWSYRVKKDFAIEFNDCVAKIRVNPESFSESKTNKGLRKCLVTKQTTVFYRFNDKTIKIVTVFDTRQHPNKLKKDIT